MTDDSPRIRLRVLGVVSFSLLIALVARLWFLQVLNADAYEQQAIANLTRYVKVDAPRGRIFDSTGELLVDNRVVTTVSIDKAEFEDAFGGTRKADQRRTVLTRLAVEISKSGQLIKVDDIETKLRNSQYSRIGEVPIALDVDDALMLLVGEHPEDYPGVIIDQTTVRDYPYGDLAAHVLGYVGPINDTEHESVKDSAKGYDLNDEIGKSGIEQLFEPQLRGTPGTRVYEVDRNERVIQELTAQNVAPIPGYDIHLTIDINLQNMAEIELRDALEEARLQERDPGDPEITAPAGAVVVLDPQNGNVLAMASYPNYSPSDFVAGMSHEQFEGLSDAENYSPILNRAIQGEYAPGSTFKPFTAYGAIEYGFMTGNGRLPSPYTRVSDDDVNGRAGIAPGGVYRLNPCTAGKCVWQNASGASDSPLRFNNVDLPTALAVSSDTYFYQIGAEIGRSETPRDNSIQDAAAMFGLGELTGVQLNAERSGRVGSREERKAMHEADADAFPEGGWFIGDTINVSVGQGETVVTPLQLANAYGAFGNGGTLYQPNLVTAVTDQVSRATVSEFGPRPRKTIDMPADVRDPILSGLVGVTSMNSEDHRGTAFNAFHATERGIDFDLDAFPVAGKTGTAEVKDAQGNSKADTALFAAFGPARGSADVKYAISVVLEQSGFGGANAAPVAATLFDALATNTVPRALTVPEWSKCLSLLADEAAAAASTTTTTTTSAAPGPTTTTTLPPPPTVDGKACR